MTGRLRRAVVCGSALVAAFAFPASASAHGIVGRADLPIPAWLFSWTAVVVLIVSFVALSTLWTTPRLQGARSRRLFAVTPRLELVGNAIGLGLFALVVYSGLAGAQVPSANFSVTFIYVIFWVGLPVASVLFGDVFRVFNPWRSTARLVGLIWHRRLGRSRRTYPSRFGVWPAVAVLVGFGWLELVYVPADRERPSTLAWLSIGYFVVMVLGMLAFGVDDWESGADGFSVYFNLLSRLAALTWRDGVAYLRTPLSGLANLEQRAGTVGLICAIIGTTTFDGASNGAYWRDVEPSLVSMWQSLGFGQTPAIELAYSVGLAFCIVLIAAIYQVGVRGMHSVSTRYGTAELTRTFAHTLAPIGFAYVFAHYFSYLIWQSQAIGYLISDPLGNGANLFGTGGAQIDYTIVSFAAIWYVQVATLVAGHVGGLALAHDRALVLYTDVAEATRSQYWMLAVMVAFTSFGLWLLSAVGT
ncbi:MAG TPA: fenitrothion hydrolase [Solirubrobacteraceae bacterium]|nr:fenitrothion hydrolase [Solirubrobacteraceae bacterium]